MMQQKTVEARLEEENRARERRKDRLRAEWQGRLVAATIRLTHAYEQIMTTGATDEGGVKVNGRAAEGQTVSASCTISVDVPVPPELSAPGEKERLKERMRGYLGQTNAHALIIETENGFILREDVFREGVKNARTWNVPLNQDIEEGRLTEGTREKLLVEGIDYASFMAKETLEREPGIPAPDKQAGSDMLTMRLGEENLVDESKRAENLFGQAKEEFMKILKEDAGKTLAGQKVESLSHEYDGELDNTHLVLIHSLAGEEEKRQALASMLDEAAQMLGIKKKNRVIRMTETSGKSGFELVPKKARARELA